ncbi:hypothetical protein CJ301_08530 [Limimaricola cinnabarinus]|uniref:XRE family transcriptional regulator n=1 Tax=Limimaricola cinnabarinus TaxID=1125964 RepID=A0A2G1MH94_9RHOB|nr:hypothetical protein CJ301_08530 [Limimaricola cinnabarinus]
MEQLIIEIEAYASATGKSPALVLREALGASWGQWDAWVEGRSSPTMRNVDRLRSYMTAHPPSPASPAA